ncbi:hypothetical protein CFC21_054659 [Triticum aestivum]|uniref:RING-type domain-containing protein n=2 Tax=Triticum aestivum TaxID=4565 RepID=A0A3B6I046_WHEAT|nr:hypothetical protein CFC21_054659 [Triticum aestivum]
MDIGEDGDHLPQEEEGLADAMDVAEDGDPLQQEEVHAGILADYAVVVLRQLRRQRALQWLQLELRVLLDTAGIIPHVGAAEAPEGLDLALAAAVDEALKMVDAPSSDDGLNCPICLEDDDTAAWKETPCGHRFHGRCVQRWLQAKGSCPMCRRQVVAMPAAAGPEYGQDVTDSVAMDDIDDDA